MDRNDRNMQRGASDISRSLRGNVDRNRVAARGIFDSSAVVPYVGTWIEMRTPANGAGVSYVVPYVGTWIEIIQ